MLVKVQIDQIKIGIENKNRAFENRIRVIASFPIF